MESLQRKLKGFDKLCDSMNCTPFEREQAGRGAMLFFEKGWPSNCFTVLMAIAAGKGQMPSRYVRARSRTRYEHSMNAAALV